MQSWLLNNEKQKYQEVTVLFFETLKGNATVKPTKVVEKSQYQNFTSWGIKDSD